MILEVLKAGALTTLQDRGRVGHAALGVGTAGPMDAAAFRLANALVGNPPDAGALEITLLGPRLRFGTATTIALTGAPCEARLDGEPLPAWRAVRVGAASELDCGRMLQGARAYLACAGGLAGRRVLGSIATDINGGFGPFGAGPLRAGDRLGGARAPPDLPAAPPAWSLDPRPWFDADPRTPIRIIRGPHFEALDAASRTALLGAHFRIRAASNRVGFRLDGPSLRLATPLELVSEPVTAGTLQLPPDGQPIALMAEHPTTGGYPRIGQIAAIDLPRLAQRRPGDHVRFCEIDLEDAQTRYLERERELTILLDRIRRRLAAHD